MSLPRSPGPRSERPDTKTLLRLGHDESEARTAAPRGAEPLRAEGTSSAEAEAQPEPVHLWFKGLREPVRARAALGGAGLQLAAALPFLELESIVGFTTGDGRALRHGRIRRVGLEATRSHPVPRLSIELDLVETPKGADAGPGQAASSEGAAQDAAPAVGGGSGPERAPRGGRVLPWVCGLLVGAAAGAGAAYGWLARAPSAHAGESAAARGPSIVEADAAQRAAALAQARAAEQARLAALWTAPRYLVQPPRAWPEADSTAAPEPAAEEAAGPAEPGPAEAGAAPAQAAASHEEHAPRELTGASWPSEPQVSVRGAQTHVFIPMRGDGQGIRQYELSTPGIAVTVPRARALIPADNYMVFRGQVRRVWLLERGEGVQVRVITKRLPERSIVSFDDAGLRIVLGP